MRSPVPGAVIEFGCRLTSPFHTSRQAYGAFAECAPFILGSTLRGAVLKNLIETHCTPERIAVLRAHADPFDVHGQCPEQGCPVKPFFPAEPRFPYSFSFGLFDDAQRLFRPRIALCRSTYSVAEGAFVVVETIAPDTPFAASVALWGDALAAQGAVIEAFGEAGEGEGIGARRSIGHGRYAVESCRARPLDEVLDQQYPFPLASGPLPLRCVTPLGLAGFPMPGAGAVDGAADWLSRRLRVAADSLGLTEHASDASEPLLSRAYLTGKTEVVNRFSYEAPPPDQRLNALVAWEGSTLTLQPRNGCQAELAACLSAASLIGIGEWSECGFGRLSCNARGVDQPPGAIPSCRQRAPL